MQKNGSVHNQKVSASMQQIKENRTFMVQLIDITLFLSNQGIAFRGHRKNEISSTRGFVLLNMLKYSYIKIIKHILGIFKETCNMVAKFNEIFANHFYSKTNCTSWSVTLF